MPALEVLGNDFQAVIQELALQNASLRIENAALKRGLSDATEAACGCGREDAPIEAASMNGREAS